MTTPARVFSFLGKDWEEKTARAGISCGAAKRRCWPGSLLASNPALLQGGYEMSEKRNDGGPAFPTERELPDGDGLSLMEGGLTVRDYFAAHATDSDVSRWIRIMGENGMPVSREAAKWLYADEMLRERDR